MADPKPIEVAIVGGGCAGISAAFELSRPEHRGRYHVTVYQVGWRLGGKGASGRGVADRIEEHGFHVWMGFYENAFRLLRECYDELGRDVLDHPMAEWHQAFLPENHIGVVDRDRQGRYRDWLAHFPAAPGLPGDPRPEREPFQIRTYLVRTATLLRALLRSCQMEPAARDWRVDAWPDLDAEAPWPNAQTVTDGIARLAKLGVVATMAGLIEAVRLLESVLASLTPYPDNLPLRLLDEIARSASRQLELLAREDDEMRRLWEVVDLVLAVLRGAVRFGLATDPRGLDAIDDYDWREWLALNGASRTSLDSAFLRGVYALMFAYEDGDPERPCMAAGQALRGAFRMFLTYRGAMFWKMRAGMGDVIFAPFYQVLRDRGVTFRFFHRLENVRISPPERLQPGERPYVEALDFDVQAEIPDGKVFDPLVEVRGLPCWPDAPDWKQLVDGDRLEREGRAFESFWDRRKVGTRTLRVVDDFDFVVLGVGLGAIPHVARELVQRDPRWQTMVEKVKTVETAAFQLWLRENVGQLGWSHPSVSVSAYVQPFETWADMPQLLSAESWPMPPGAIAYFCGVLPDGGADRFEDPGYPARRRADVRAMAVDFLERDVEHFWPKAIRAPHSFRWELLMEAGEPGLSLGTGGADASRFDTQFYTANVNPTDRYVLSLPGTARHRISPLDNSYDNLTVAGDWTECGHNAGCVEAAVMSGRLAAHAISGTPALEDIVGYDHP